MWCYFVTLRNEVLREHCGANDEMTKIEKSMFRYSLKFLSFHHGHSGVASDEFRLRDVVAHNGSISHSKGEGYFGVSLSVRISNGAIRRRTKVTDIAWRTFISVS